MIVALQRMADRGRNYSFLGAMAGCFVGAAALAPGFGSTPQNGGFYGFLNDIAHAAGTVDFRQALVRPFDNAALAAVVPTLALHLPVAYDNDLVPPPTTAEWLASRKIEAPLPDLLTAAVAALPTSAPPTLASGEPAPRGPNWRHGVPRHLKRLTVETAVELTEVFLLHGYSLDDVRRGVPAPSLQVESVPADLAKVEDGNERKRLFMKTLLPIVLEANERLLAERTEVARLRDIWNRNPGGLNVSQRLWLAEIADRYDTKPDDFDDLLHRIDVIPPSMALAQAGVESGWGTSYAARVGNALFGQIQSTGRHSVAVPWKPGPQMPQPFANLREAVDAYLLNLNTHRAYAGFRAERSTLRSAGKPIDGYHLIGRLDRYSELGPRYIAFVRAIMRENKLDEFDAARLQPL